MSGAKKAELTRQQILDAGHALVLRKGFSALSIKDIVDVCQVPKGSFYYYFPSKEQFGCELLERYVQSYEQRMETILSSAGTNGRERLMRYWNAWIDDPQIGGWAEHCLVVKLGAEIADLSDAMRLILHDGVMRLTDRLARTIMEGRGDGSLPLSLKPEAAARTLYHLWLGAALVAKLGQDKAPLRDALVATERELACHTAPMSPVNSSSSSP
ncbi:Transcriptional regulator, TetR family [Acetobacter malorum]|nr:Transcriptional regulator, TetR family [Acetobacter malorum]